MKIFSSRVLHLLAALGLLTSVARAELPRTAPRWGVSGSILQPQGWMNDLSDDEFEARLANFKRTGGDTILIQWAQFDQYAYFSESSDDPKLNLIGRILKLSEKLDLKVYVGVHFDSRWFSQWKWNDIEYMKKNLADNEKVVPLLAKKFGQYKSFAGWYLPHEIADWDYRDLSIFAPEIYNLRLFYGKLAELCKKNLDRPVAMSAFFVSRYTPQYVEYSFREMLKGTHVDALLVQDGRGVRHWRSHAEQIAPYYRAFELATRANGIALWSIVETFDLKETVKDFSTLEQINVDLAFEPAPFASVLDAVSVQRKYVSKVVQFDFFYYMDPAKGEKQKVLFDQVLRHNAGH